MCGIAGIFDLKGITSQDIGKVKRFNEIQKHRGPDDEGLFSDTTCVLGHRRLAIIDLSSGGHQPFTSDDGRYQLVYNGEIYNYIELREELKKFGWSFRTRTDTEVLLKAYLQFGEGCLHKFNGMFAFVVYDAQEKSLFFARDRMGIKPLYYCCQESAVIFASEIKALLSDATLDRTVNRQALFDYLVFNRTDIFDETFFQHIQRLPQGHCATFSGNGLKIKCWWDPESFLQEPCLDTEERIYQTIEQHLVSSVQLRMRSDVPVGSCLSGGMDSSVLTGILFQKGWVDKKYPTFTASFPGHPIDETRYIEKLQSRYPFKNSRTYPSPKAAFENIRDFVYTNDEPTTTPSFYSQYEVMRLARERGVTVLLDGQGGDENFAGYQYFHGFYMNGLLREKRIRQFFSEFLKVLIRRQHASAFQTLLFQLLPDTYRQGLLLRTSPFIQRDFFHQHIKTSRIYRRFFDAKDLNTSLVRHFQYKLEHLLRMEDRNSMAFSLEARVPYLDHRLVEYVLGVDADLKIKAGETKYLQKRAVGRYTIPEILERKDKIGFGTPGEEWMRTPSWAERTDIHYHELTKNFPEIFVKGAFIPHEGFHRWKVNQLAVWKEVFC